MKLANLLIGHRKMCVHSNCICKTLAGNISQYRKDTYKIKEPRMAYISIEEIPEEMKSSYTVKWLYVIMNDIVGLGIRVNDFMMKLAEIQYYYFGNH